MPESQSEVAYICKGPKVEGGGRIPCGNNVTALVLGVPADGVTYAIECPKCGTATKVTRTPPETP